MRPSPGPLHSAGVAGVSAGDVAGRLRSTNRGFTLVELLIVIVVLGVLAGIVALAAGSFRSSSVEAACAQDRRIVVSAVEAYKVRHSGAPPGTLADLTTAGYLRNDGSITAAGKTGEGYLLTYAAGAVSDCASSMSGGGGPAAGSVTITSIPELTRNIAQNVVITGTGFVSGAVVTFSPAITTSEPTVQDATRIRFTIAGPHAAAGSYTVTVTNPDGGSATGTLVIS